MIGRVFLLLVSAILLATEVLSQNLLPFEWSYRRGDEAAWYTADHRPKGWEAINLGLSWESQGIVSGGVIGLRSEAVVPRGYRKTGLRLVLRMHGQETDMYVNGRAIVTNLPRGEERAVLLPDDVVCWGQQNQLALRVRDHLWTGGEVLDHVRLVPADGSTADVRLEATLPDQHLFSADRAVTVPLRLHADGKMPITGWLGVTLHSDFHERILSRSESVTVTASGLERRIDLGRLAPGFYRLRLRFSGIGVESQAVHMLAVSPDRIVAPPDPVADFDAFWSRTLAELAATPPRFVVRRDEEHCTPRHEVFTVEMTSLGGIVVRGWYVTPKASGRYPAILHLQGYSVAMRPEWFRQDDDVIRFGLDIRGHGRSADVVNPGFGLPGYVGYGVEDADRYVYRGAYMDVGRALEFLASRPEVDPSRIAVEGMSQGGGLTFAAAALFPDRVAAAAAGVPFLSAFTDHIRIRRIYAEEMRAHLKENGGAWRDLLRTMNLIDIRNLAPRIRCPVFLAAALRDDDCPPHIGFAAYNNVPGAKEFILLPEDGHLMNGKWPDLSRRWIRRRLGLP